MESELQIFNTLPLKELTLRRVATILWGQVEMYMCAAKLNLDERKKMNDIEERTVDFLSKNEIKELPLLTEPVKKELIITMRPVYREITKWLNFHETFLNIHTATFHRMRILEHLCFTAVGTINYQKTAKALIHNSKLNTIHRYKLACLYCFECDVKKLWPQVPKRSKKTFFGMRVEPFPYIQTELVVFWTYLAKGKVSKLSFHRYRHRRGQYSSLHHYLFENAALNGFGSATQYFLEKLDLAEREVSLVKTAKTVAEKVFDEDESYSHEYQKFNDVLCYLVSVMNKEELKDVLVSEPAGIVKPFLDWPRQSRFNEFANLAYPYLEHTHYDNIIHFLSERITSHYCYIDLYQECFMKCPRDKRILFSLYLSDFCKLGDVDNIKFIFRNMNLAERLEVTFSGPSMSNIHELIYNDKWGIVRIYLEEAKLPKDVLPCLYFEILRMYELTMDQRMRQLWTDLMDEFWGHRPKYYCSAL